MRVLLVRHADAAPGEPDELRALTPAGRAASRELGRRLAADHGEIAAVVTSPLLRARQTAAAIAAAVGVEPEADERLAPGATAASVLACVAGRSGTVVVIGHQPDCGRIVAELTGGEPPPFPPAGVLELELDAG
jgi:phosphohistidine phosphatase